MNEDMNRQIPKLRVRAHGVSNGLWNAELAMVAKEDRTWGIYKYISLWIAMSACIPAYMLASGLVALGMNWKQALGTLLLGNFLVVVPMVLNAHAGAKYGIPFAIYARASFGVLGARIAVMLRSLVGCGWFGIQCWIGGQALFFMVKALLPSLGAEAAWWSFAAVWLLSMAIMWRGTELLKPMRFAEAGAMLLVALVMMIWTADRAGGLGLILSGATNTPAEFRKIFLPSLTAVVGFWSAVAVNISDDARFAESRQSQMAGTAVGLPAAMTLWSFVAIAATLASATVRPDHRPTWNPAELIASFHRPVLGFVGLASILLATLVSSFSANVSGWIAGFSNIRSGLISSRMGGLETGLVGILLMPWRLMADPARYIDGWLLGCSGLLGPLAGIMIADYFILRKRSLDVDELYMRGGIYEFEAGFNPRALIALAVGAGSALAGTFVPRLHWLYEGAWFIGFAVSAAVYLALMSGPDVAAMIPPTPLLLPVDGFEGEPTA